MKQAAIVRIALVGAASALVLMLARRYDFVCDDAFIALRYARNLAEHGQPLYNLGERVEGYTSFSWVVLVAIGMRVGIPTVLLVQLLGGLSSIGLMAATFGLWRRMHADRPGLGGLVLCALALSAPLAAWTMGGLETPLFACLTTWSIAVAIDLVHRPDRRRSIVLGLTLGATILTRPEGVLVAAALGMPLMVAVHRQRRIAAVLPWLAATLGLLVGAHLAWRWSYYGYPLPNTFYVKSSGDTTLLRNQGVRYVTFAAHELGLGLVVAMLAAGLFFRKQATSGSPMAEARWFVVWTARLLLPTYVAYVVTVGGDFLDLYRFFVPLLPLAFVLVGSAVTRWLSGFERPWLPWAIGLALVVWHGVHQSALAERAQQVSEPGRAEHGIEPLGWTRLYALRWAAIGRWIGEHAAADDWMAVGAAGAMPYYAGIRNLDTFGLCDAWVSHHAPVVGQRPGHQRFAPESYILSKRPAFLLIGNDFSSDTPATIPRDRYWAQRGYVWAEARIDAQHFAAPASFYHYMLMRRDRAQERVGSRWLRLAPAAASAAAAP